MVKVTLIIFSQSMYDCIIVRTESQLGWLHSAALTNTTVTTSVAARSSVRP